LRGKAEPASDERRLDLKFGQRREQSPALQTLFQRPGRIARIPGLDDEKKRGVEAELLEPRRVRPSPFPCGVFRQAPQHEVSLFAPLCLIGDHGKGKAKRRRRVAIGLGLDLVQPPSLQSAKRQVRIFPVMPAKAGIQ
jgi:hypothetical protein